MFKPLSLSGKIFKRYLLFPAHPAKIRLESWIGKLFFSSGIQLGNEEGVVFKLDANDWITRIMLEDGNYEAGSVNLARSLVKEEAVFVDIGANFGLYSCQVGFKKDKLKLIAIDPNYLVLGKLINNLKLNQLQNNCSIVNSAVTDRFQLVFMDLPSANNLGSAHASTSNKGGVSVLSCPLQYILESNNVNKVELLKIDIEGNEFDVFKSFPFEAFLIKNIIMEFNHLSKVGFAEMKYFFESRGFALYTIDGKEISSESQPIPESNIWLVNKTAG